MVRRRRSRWAGFWLAVLMLAVIVAGAWLALRTPPPTPGAAPDPSATPFIPRDTATVVRVSDGDTLDLRYPDRTRPARIGRADGRRR